MYRDCWKLWLKITKKWLAGLALLSVLAREIPWGFKRAGQAGNVQDFEQVHTPNENPIVDTHVAIRASDGASGGTSGGNSGAIDVTLPRLSVRALGLVAGA